MKSLFKHERCINPVRVTLIDNETILIDFVIAFFNGSYSYTFDIKYKSENIFQNGFISKSSLKYPSKNECLTGAYTYIKEKLNPRFDNNSSVTERIKLFFEVDKMENQTAKPVFKKQYEIEFSELFA